MSKNLDLTKNFGIIAHVDAGKTTLTERILFYSKKIHRKGEVHEGSAKTDWMKLERERGITIQSAATFFEWSYGDNLYTMNLIDTPGHVDFTYEVEKSMRILDNGILVIDSVEGVEPQTRTVWDQGKRYDVPLVCFINKLDRMGASFENSFRSLQVNFREANFCPLIVNLDDNYLETYDVLRMLVYRWSDGDFTESPWSEGMDPRLYSYRKELMDSLAEVDEAIFETISMDGTPSTESMLGALVNGYRKRKLFPLIAGSALKNTGIQSLLNYVVTLFQSPLIEDLKGLNALIFKVQKLPKLGLVAYLRIYSGSLKKGDYVYNLRLRKKIRVTRISVMHVIENFEVQSASAGDIVVLPSIDFRTGDNLVSDLSMEPLYPMSFPEPVVSISVSPKKNSPTEFEKLAESIKLLTIQDPSLKYQIVDLRGLKQHIISGMGELHLQIVSELIKDESGIEIEVGKPKVEYKSTLIKESNVVYTFKRQTGGSGLWAKIYARFIPIEDMNNIEFVNKVVGGVIPNELIPSVEEGIRYEAGVGVARYPSCTGFRVELYDGETHPVDSKKKAFELAGRYALREAFEANTRLLEPVMKVEITSKEDYFGNISADINNRRGIINSVSRPLDKIFIDAFIPLGKLFGYVDNLRSLTRGEVSVFYSLSHYEYVPRDLESDLLENL